MTSPGPDGSRWSGRRLLIGLAVAAIVFSGVRLGLVLKFMREQAVESGERLTESFAQIIGEQTIRTFQTVDQRLLLAASGLRELESAGSLNELSARALLRAEIKDLPFVRAVWMLDATGRIVYDSDEGNIGMDFADRDYFQAFQRAPGRSFYIGVPIRSRTTGTWLISAAHSLRSPTGDLEGVLVGAVDPHYFDRLWREIDLGPGGSITLFRRDGILMMRSPFDDDAMGRVFERLPTFTALRAGRTVGTFMARSAFDDTLRIFAFRTSAVQSDLVVVVGKSHDLVLAPWREFAVFAMSAWVAASIAIVMLGAFLNRIWLARLRTEAQVEHMAERLKLEVIEGKEAEARLAASLREKEALLKEVHHRVKNNLQVITSLLRLEQSRTAAPATRSVLTDMQGRIRSMALLHETLYRTGVFAEVDLATYLRGLVSQLFRSHNEKPAEIQLVLDLSPVKVGIDQAIPCGLIVNELVTNSLKHGFTQERGGEVRVALRLESDGRVRLEVSDTGVGLPADFEAKRGNSLGLQLVADLARQLRGQLDVGPGPAARFAVTFQADSVA